MSVHLLTVFCISIVAILSFFVGYVWGTVKTNKKFDKYLAVFDKEIMGYISRDPNELLLEEKDVDDTQSADVIDFLKYRAMREHLDREDDDR